MKTTRRLPEEPKKASSALWRAYLSALVYSNQSLESWTDVCRPNMAGGAGQLETFVYVGTAWMQYLPGTYTPDPKTVGLKIDEASRSYRKGYFLGDDTGAGKRR